MYRPRTILRLLGLASLFVATLALAIPPDEAWPTVSPEAAGADPAAIEAVLDYARDQHSSGMVIVYKGRILAERHWTPPANPRYQALVYGTDAHGAAREDVASAQKSIVSFLIGVAVSKQLIDIEDPVIKYLGIGWSNAAPEQEQAITVRHLLSMTSGLDTGLQYKVAPGTEWQYNTNAYSKLVQVLEAVAEDSITHITANWLTQPTGMADSGWEKRPWVTAGQDANAIGYVTTPRDLARFGLLMLDNGNWGEKNLITNKTWLHASIASSQILNPAYGYLWWLNQPTSIDSKDSTPRRLIPTAPDDLYAAQGALGRKLYIVPSKELIVTRLGDAPAKDFNEVLWSKLSKIWKG